MDNKYETEQMNLTATYIPTQDESDAKMAVLKDYIRGRMVINKTYGQFNGRNLFDCIDDWTKRWNGYIPKASPLLEKYQSRIFLNFTRNQIISYLAKTALNIPKPTITAVNKKSNLEDKKFAEVLKDLNQFSLNAENGDARFLESAIEVTTKGTIIKYEGYAKSEQELDVPQNFNALTGKVVSKKQKKIVYDDCYQELVPIEDFYIANPYQPDIQKQPFVCWRKITSYQEAETEYGHYPNFKCVPKAAYLLASEPTTFYRNTLQTELGMDRVEIIRYYNKSKNFHCVILNSIVIYEGPIPFKDGRYPFAKGIFEPFDNFFFWGASFVHKIQGDQDLLNTLWNMMIDKNYGSLLPFGLSSDTDDFIEDETLTVNKIRKVGDVNAWKFVQLPGVNAGETSMLSLAKEFATENSGGVQGAGSMMSPKGGRLPVWQIMIQQQETMAKIGFSTSFLENFERDRTELRISHILQFYSIPKVEKITGKNGKEIEKLAYRDIKLSNYDLSNGKKGTKVIKIVENPNQEAKMNLENELSVMEAQGEITGTPTEALALVIDTFTDYNFEVQIVTNSSYQRNSILDQKSRQEFAAWRIALLPVVPCDVAKLLKWVEEPMDIPVEEFELENPQAQQGMPGMNPMQQGMPQGQGGQNPLQNQLKQAGLPNLPTLQQPTPTPINAIR
jgi:hypothetical protein